VAEVRRIRRGWTAALLVLALTLAAATTSAGPAAGQAKPVEDEIDAIKDDAGLASVEEAKLVSLEQAASTRQKELEAKVATANQQVRRVESDLSNARGNLSALEARKRALDARLVETNQHLADAKSRRVQLALDAYTGRSSALGYASSILDARDLGALAARRSYEHVVGESQSEAAAKEEVLRDQATDLLEELDGVRRQMAVKRAGLDGQVAQIEKQQQVRTGLIQQAEAEVAEHTRIVDEATARRAEFEADLAQVEAASKAVEATLRQRQGGTAAPEPSESAGSSVGDGGGRLGHPLPGHALGSPYGYRVHPIFGSVRLHTGVDIGASTGTPIHAAGDGVVVSAGTMGGYGNATVIDHGNGLATLYGHQSKIDVSAGQHVTRGQVIGKVGCTGTCLGAHLHFEVRINGRPVNPAPYIT
jgi:murein DD-endopeptidase MepM/ murein hydrolase activator NlpD